MNQNASYSLLWNMDRINILPISSVHAHTLTVLQNKVGARHRDSSQRALAVRLIRDRARFDHTPYPAYRCSDRGHEKNGWV